MAIGRPGHLARGVGDGLRPPLAAAQILNPQAEQPAPHPIFSQRHARGIGAERQAAELIVVAALGLAVFIDQQLPVAAAGRLSFMQRVIVTGAVAHPVDPVAVTHRHRGIFGIDARFQLGLELLAQFGRRRQLRLGKGVLGLQMGQHLRVVALVITQPVPRIDAGFTVVLHLERLLGGLGRLVGVAVAHRGFRGAGQPRQQGQQQKRGDKGGLIHLRRPLPWLGLAWQRRWAAAMAVSRRNWEPAALFRSGCAWPRPAVHRAGPCADLRRWAAAGR